MKYATISLESRNLLQTQALWLTDLRDQTSVLLIRSACAVPSAVLCGFIHCYIKVSPETRRFALLVPGVKPINEAGPIYKSCGYIDLYRRKQRYIHLC